MKKITYLWQVPRSQLLTCISVPDHRIHKVNETLRTTNPPKGMTPFNRVPAECPHLRWLSLPNRTLYGVVGALLNQRSHIPGFHNSHTSWFGVNTGTIYQQKMTGKFTQSVRRTCSMPSSFLSQILGLPCLFASLIHPLWGISGQVRGETQAK